ncbi:MAG TPA: hypothetical protein VFI02_09325, partial [Armatimonadota bacterium]|nr:hypothetical protein [Armatimonadota bacterium]
MKALLLCMCMSLSCQVCADQPGIHRMVVGDRALELQYAFPLTFQEDGEVECAWISPDGKYVAYVAGQRDPEVIRLGIVRSSGGRPTILLSTPPDGLTTEEPAEGWYPEIDTDLPIVWSPDSKLIAFYAFHSSADSSPPADAVWVMTTHA